MFILTLIPIELWIGLSAFAATVYIATHFLRFIPIPAIKVYKLPIQIASVAIFILGIFITGIVFNENSWQVKLKAEQEKYEQAKKDQEVLNAKLGEETEAKLTAIKNTAVQLKRQSESFTQVIKAKDATVQNIIESFDKAAKAKYDALSAADKEKANKQMQEAIDFQKTCPVVPELYINRLNNSAQNPNKDLEKK